MKYLLYLLLSTALTIAQNKNDQAGLNYLDEVKQVYGNPCEIGVSSDLIDSLYHYKDIYAVKDYLSQYENIRDRIKSFRYENEIKMSNLPVITFDMSKRFFGKEKNIINACGMLFGVSGVNKISLSLVLHDNEIDKFYSETFKMKNYYYMLKNELSEVKNDWRFSHYLVELLLK